MSVIILLIIIGTVVASGFLIAFLWAVRSGQYDDTVSPGVRILFEEKKGVTLTLLYTKVVAAPLKNRFSFDEVLGLIPLPNF